MNKIVNETIVTNNFDNTIKTERNQVNSVKGRTIGKVKLSDEAAKYYEELKSKYSNMEFVLVSSDMKEQAKAHAASFANPSKMVVLIDEEKIERMATDVEYRKQYESIISNAANSLSQLASKAENGNSGILSYGMQINDDGTASFFAVIDKSLAAQRERIEEKAEENLKEKKAERKEQEKERLEKFGERDTVTIKASSVEELIKKIDDLNMEIRSDNVRTAEEQNIGMNFDFSV